MPQGEPNPIESCTCQSITYGGVVMLAMSPSCPLHGNLAELLESPAAETPIPEEEPEDPPELWPGNGVEPPVDRDLTIAETERMERERLEEQMRQAAAGERGPHIDENDDFIPTGKINIWLGTDGPDGVDQLRFQWTRTVPSTTVIGACNVIADYVRTTMVRGLDSQ
jgi:hypothetical protein